MFTVAIPSRFRASCFGGFDSIALVSVHMANSRLKTSSRKTGELGLDAALIVVELAERRKFDR